jgi:hypothetical protein
MITAGETDALGVVSVSAEQNVTDGELEFAEGEQREASNVSESAVPELGTATAMNELPHLEPIPLPDLASLDVMPPLPAWVGARVAAISRASDRNAAGHYRNGPWMPVELLPAPAQRMVIERHVDALKRLMRQTPDRDAAAERAMLDLVMKLLQALPGQRTTAIEARAEAFMVALESDPWWAVAEAIRGWYRGKYGKGHNYTRQPAPAVLHELAMREAWKIGGRMRLLEELLNAEAPLTFSNEHRKRMLTRLATEIPLILGTRHPANAETSEAV